MGVIFDALRDALRSESPVALATVIDGPDSGAKLLVHADGRQLGTLGNEDLDRVVARDALAELESGSSGVRHYGLFGEARQADLSVFIEAHAARPQLVIFGAVDFTRGLAAQGKLLGFRVTVCDAREVFATRRRFPMADEVVVDWPNRLLDRIGGSLGARDAVCVLTHDNKFDVPAITSALATNVGYIGAMGSRRTTDTRNDRLREEGVSDADIARVMAPIGLDIGSRSPEETAVSIVAEIISSRTGRGAPNLRDRDGAIH
jgi:xanthine dehydrogenase accessory factor